MLLIDPFFSDEASRREALSFIGNLRLDPLLRKLARRLLNVGVTVDILGTLFAGLRLQNWNVCLNVPLLVLYELESAKHDEVDFQVFVTLVVKNLTGGKYD